MLFILLDGFKQICSLSGLSISWILWSYPQSPVLLILDGHNTRNIDVIDLALKHHVIILTIPPHSSHKLQPLDKTFMGAFKTYYSEEIRMWTRNNARPLSAFDVAELFNNAYVKVQTALIAINSSAKLISIHTTDIFLPMLILLNRKMPLEKFLRKKRRFFLSNKKLKIQSKVQWKPRFRQ